ncbi:MAG: hypothetical protein QW207_03370 [Candidatus Micrarchaeaceae archaeon]
MATNSYTYAVVTAQQLHLSKNFVVLDIIAARLAASGAALISISLLKKERLEGKRKMAGHGKNKQSEYLAVCSHS